MAGLVTGLTRMIMDFAYGAPLCGQDEYRPAVLYKVKLNSINDNNFDIPWFS